MSIPTSEEILAQAKHLVAILENPEPGLMTWLSFRTEAAVKLYKMLGQVLGKIESPS